MGEWGSVIGVGEWGFVIEVGASGGSVIGMCEWGSVIGFGVSGGMDSTKHILVLPKAPQRTLLSCSHCPHFCQIRKHKSWWTNSKEWPQASAIVAVTMLMSLNSDLSAPWEGGSGDKGRCPEAVDKGLTHPHRWQLFDPSAPVLTF